MKILFLGNFEAEYSSENYYRQELERMGHTVIAAQERKTSVRQLGNFMRGHIDAFFWVHTHGWRTDGIEHFLRICKQKRIPTFAYHLDLYLGIERERQLYRDPFFTVDHFFTVDKLMADWLNDNGKAKGHFLPAGCFENDCFAGTPNKRKYPHEIIFTGSKHYHPEWPYRHKLIDWLKATYGDKFAHYGGGGLPGIRGHELNNLYASAKIVIGDTLCKDFTYPWYSSDRLFEVTGRGGFLIYPRIEGLETMFKEDEEIVFYDFNDFEDLKTVIDFYLENDAEREEIRLAGQIRVKTEHTYRHRLETILETIKVEVEK